ncbi:MAG: hypothetical protein U0790_24995 [Isosphaeraceae bacterium]
MASRNPGPASIPFEDPSAAALRALRGHLELEEVEAARGVYDQSRRKIAGWQPPPADWLVLISSLIRYEFWDDAIRVLEAYLAEVESPSPRARLKLAQLLIQKQARPARALRVLGEIPRGSLPSNLEPIREQLTRQAERMQDEGPLELGDEV